jgi:hypothetical protein
MKLLKQNTPGRAVLLVLWIAFASLVHAAPERPFKGSLELEERIGRVGRCPGAQGQPGLGGTLQGSGHATHLGAVQVSGLHCIASEPGIPPSSFRLFDGQMALRAANGDVVLANYSGVFTLAATGGYTFQGEYVITGGTGRFSDASGAGALSGSLQGELPSFEQSVFIDAEGSIDY